MSDLIVPDAPELLVPGVPEEGPPPEAPPEPPLNGVMVQRHDMPDGNFGTSLTLVGDCRRSEVESLLKNALRGVQRDLAGE